MSGQIYSLIQESSADPYNLDFKTEKIYVTVPNYTLKKSTSSADSVILDS